MSVTEVCHYNVFYVATNEQCHCGSAVTARRGQVLDTLCSSLAWISTKVEMQFLTRSSVDIINSNCCLISAEERQLISPKKISHYLF